MKISVESFRGKLRIRFGYRGKRICVYLGIVDSPQNRAYAESIKGTIERDILLNNFDETLLRYKPWVLGNSATELNCSDLFERFTNTMAKEKGLYQGSLRRYQGCLSHIRRSLKKEAHNVNRQDAENFRSALMERVSNRTAKEYLWMVQGCFDWAKGKYRVPEQNPFVGLAARIKPELRQKVKPFTEGEIRAILAEFRRDRYYSHYADFVAFLFGIGCRFGEAAGLCWKHVSSDFQTVWIGESVSRGTRKSTKTGRSRTVILSPTVSKILQSRFIQMRPNPSDLVFPAPKGGSICDHTFRRRAWKTILRSCGIEYRKPYAARHSAISHALAAGVNPVDLAEQTGHDKRVLLNVYAHVVNPQVLFREYH
jgi:integrase